MAARVEQIGRRKKILALLGGGGEREIRTEGGSEEERQPASIPNTDDKILTALKIASKQRK